MPIGSHIDDRPWLYCAGKINPNDWRVSVFGYEVGGSSNPDDPRGWSDPGTSDNVIFEGLGSGGHHPSWRYAGPFYIRCDHRCGHGPASHGCGVTHETWEGVSESYANLNTIMGAEILGDPTGCFYTLSPRREQVVEASLIGIGRADRVMVWIGEDFSEPYGTVAEMGAAKAMHKPIHVFVSPKAPNLTELWFPLMMATTIVRCDTPEEAVDALHGYHSADSRKKWRTYVEKELDKGPL